LPRATGGAAGIVDVSWNSALQVRAPAICICPVGAIAAEAHERVL
jgi:hypothetical protein